MPATHDTPQERDDKASTLKTEEEDRAAQIALEVKRFRWEMRTYIAVLFVLFFTK